MGRLTIRFGFYVVILIFGILMGMDLAEKGIHRITGSPSETVQYVEITNQAKKIFLPKKTTSELQNSPEIKKEKTTPQKPVKPEQVTFISKVGNILGGLAKTGTDKGMELIASLIP